MPTAADFQVAAQRQQTVDDAAKLEAMDVGKILVNMTAFPAGGGDEVRVSALFDPTSVSFQTLLDIMKPLGAVKGANAQQELANLGLADAPAVVPDTPGGTRVLVD